MRRDFILAILLLLLPLTGFTQTSRIAVDSANSADSTDRQVAPDSAVIARLRVELAEARLAEANLKVEIGQLRLPLAADSIAQARLRARVDSLRRVTPGFPVVVEGDTLLRIYAKRGGHTPASRAKLNTELITDLGRRLTLRPDSLRVENSDIVTDLVYGDEVILSLTDQDGLWENRTRQELADSLRTRIVAKLGEMHEEHGWRDLAKRAALFLAVVAGQWALIKLTNWAFRKVRRRICRRRERMKSILFRDYELLDTRRQVRLMLFTSNIARYVTLLIQLLISVPLLFAIFPRTQSLAYSIFSYIWTPFKTILLGVVDYIPNLFTIGVIWLVTRYAVRGVRYLADEIHSEKLRIGGFYADWAIPTFHIVRFLLYAFMVAMIYPYLPGSGSGVFQSISVFVGLIISLGSSTVVGNILAGLVITYMRPFRLGDRIRLNETTGNVIEKTAFVTRLRTPRNEVVTIPNSFLMSSHTVNYSASAREYGLLIHTEVTIGYDTPWRKVHQLLTDSARATPGIVAEPEPFVLETSLSDYYPVYQLHACIREADRMAHILSQLNQTIQDRFAAAGVEIMSPAYTAYRNGNASTIPDPPGKS